MRVLNCKFKCFCFEPRRFVWFCCRVYRVWDGRLSEAIWIFLTLREKFGTWLQGFAELEYGMLQYMGAIDESTPVVTSGMYSHLFSLKLEILTNNYFPFKIIRAYTSAQSWTCNSEPVVSVGNDFGTSEYLDFCHELNILKPHENNLNSNLLKHLEISATL